MRRLSDPPAPGEVMRLRGAVLSIPGNSVHASDVITLSPDELVFTADNYTRGGATGRTLMRANYVGEWRGPCIDREPKVYTRGPPQAGPCCAPVALLCGWASHAAQGLSIRALCFVAYHRWSKPVAQMAEA